MEYNILWCRGCNAIAITDEDIDCLACNKPFQTIGFLDERVQGILEESTMNQEKL